MYKGVYMCKQFKHFHSRFQNYSYSYHAGFDTEMCAIKRQSMDRHCDVLLRLHQQSGFDSVSLNYDTLRKRLSDAVREFGYLLAAHANFQSLGATEYPQGLLSACEGCWRASQPSPVVSTSA